MDLIEFIQHYEASEKKLKIGKMKPPPTDWDLNF